MRQPCQTTPIWEPKRQGAQRQELKERDKSLTKDLNLTTEERYKYRMYGIIIYPNMFCEKCNMKLRLREHELGKHMKQVHRYFRCEIDPDCRFEGESDLARKVHIK